MENYSINSSIRKSISSKGTTTRSKDSAEESGWTAYFEDYDHQQNSQDCSSSFSCSSSLISDAATTGGGGAAWKITHNDHRDFACSSTCAATASPKVPKKLRFKKTSTKEICGDDDSLEDTASSPVNSPKVSDFKSKDINPSKREDQIRIYSSLGKETASENYSDIQIEEEKQNEF